MKSSSAGHGRTNIEELLKNCSHYDRDERYMATNDICVYLQSGVAIDPTMERMICDAILKQLG